MDLNNYVSLIEDALLDAIQYTSDLSDMYPDDEYYKAKADEYKELLQNL